MVTDEHTYLARQQVSTTLLSMTNLMLTGLVHSWHIGLLMWPLVITLRASEAAVQCIVIAPVCLCVCFLWVCYHDNSKLHASILTKLGLQVKVVTISSWLNFGSHVPPGRGLRLCDIFGSALLQPGRSVCVSSSAFFHYHKVLTGCQLVHEQNVMINMGILIETWDICYILKNVPLLFLQCLWFLLTDFNRVPPRP